MQNFKELCSVFKISFFECTIDEFCNSNYAQYEMRYLIHPYKDTIGAPKKLSKYDSLC